MEKEQGKNRGSRICLLVSLTVIFWLGLFYFHFMILGGSSTMINHHQSIPREKPLPVLANNESSANNNDVGAEIVRFRSHSAVSDHEYGGGSVDSRKLKPEDDGGRNKTDSRKLKPEDDGGRNKTDSRKLKPEDDGGRNKTNSRKLKPEDDGGRNKVVESYPFMRALRTVDNKSDPCGGRYIYVHDLPPRFNEDMLRECKSLSMWTNMCKFISNAGLGPPMENAGEEGVFSDSGWYATNQFAVDVIFNNRMKQYECLTRDSSLAAAIFVPFYAGFDIARYLWGYNTSTRDAASLALIDWLTKKPEWKIMGGKDHFLVGGRITWDFRRKTDQETDWGNNLLFLPASKNMSMLVVEASPWNFNDFGIPYPTYFHPAKDADMLLWQDRVRKTERKWLFCFAGARRPGDRKSIRDQIINQCKGSKVCKLLECSLGDSKCHSPSSIMQMFQSSVFCLQPQGDSYTRRSAFDAILAGCIPVFFHPASAYTQYTWHLPRNISKYSVLIPENDVRKKNISIEQWLSKYSQEQTRKMTEEVIKLIPRITYADPRSKMETVKDAFDVAVEAVIKRVTKSRKDIVQGYKDDDRIEALSWKYALLEEGENEVKPHEWDSFFKLENDDDTSTSAADAAKNSWKLEHGQQQK